MCEDGDDSEKQNLPRNHGGGQCRPLEPADGKVQQDDGAGQQKRKNQQRENAVSPSPPECQVGGGPVEIGKDVDVREVGSDQQGGGTVGRPPAQSASRQRGTDQSVTDGVDVRLVSRSGA